MLEGKHGGAFHCSSSLDQDRGEQLDQGQPKEELALQEMKGRACRCPGRAHGAGKTHREGRAAGDMEGVMWLEYLGAEGQPEDPGLNQDQGKDIEGVAGECRG